MVFVQEGAPSHTPKATQNSCKKYLPNFVKYFMEYHWSRSSPKSGAHDNGYTKVAIEKNLAKRTTFHAKRAFPLNAIEILKCY